MATRRSYFRDAQWINELFISVDQYRIESIGSLNLIIHEMQKKARQKGVVIAGGPPLSQLVAVLKSAEQLDATSVLIYGNDSLVI